jgi:hypothetical protein
VVIRCIHGSLLPLSLWLDNAFLFETKTPIQNQETEISSHFQGMVTSRIVEMGCCRIGEYTLPWHGNNSHKPAIWQPPYPMMAIALKTVTEIMDTTGKREVGWKKGRYVG